MKARFIGDPRDDFSGPKTIPLFGRTFPKGRFVTIEGDDAEKVIGKLQANDHFEVGEGEGEAPAAVAAEVAEAGPPAVSKTGGSRSKEAVVADLDALALKHPGKVEYDARLGAPKLAAILEELKFELGED